jgi:imidazolonepropionase-like amidohydrolase
MKQALLLLLRNSHKTGTVSSVPPDSQTSSFAPWRRLVAPFALLGLTLGTGWTLPETPGAVAIKDARVVTVSGEELPKATVVLRNGLIVDVGASSIPADAWVIDGAGLTVYPGFIDALSTWGIPAPPARGGAASTAAAAATPPEPRARGPEDRPQTFSFERAADLVSPTDQRLAAARAAGFTSAATYPNKGIFHGLGAMIDLAGERGRDMVIVQPVGQQISFRQGGFGRTGFPGSLMGNISYVRQLFLDLDQYQEAKQISAANPSEGKRPEYDHALEGLAESPRLLLPAEESQQIDRMLNFAAELKKPFILYGLHEAYERIDELKQAKTPLLVSLKWPEKLKDEDPTDVPTFRELTMREKAPSVPGLLANAGVRFAFYSDGVDSAAELKKALKKALDAGLSRADAIRALTLNAAEIYGVADRLGTVEKGKIANLVVMKGDAFDDKTTIEYVFVDGRQFQPSKELQQGPPPGGKKPATPAAQDGGIER